MAKARILTTDAEIDAALERAKHHVPGPAAIAVQHLLGPNLLVVSLNNGRRLALPIEDLQGLTGTTPDQLAEIEILGPGTGISFERIDVAFKVESLLKGIYGNSRWMQQLETRKPQAA